MTWRGRFFDGQSTQRHDVDISLSFATLHFRLSDDTYHQWPLDRVKWMEKPSDLLISRIGLTTNPDARLEVDGADFVDAIRTQYPDIDRAAAKHDRHARSAVVICIGCAALAGLFFASVYGAPKFIAPLIPLTVKQAIGDSIVRQTYAGFGKSDGKKSGYCHKPTGHIALKNLLARLERVDDRVKGVVVTVIDRKLVNAFAAPGGRLVIFEGLIDFANSPDEFTGILAHEIGHSIHMHPTKAVIREIGLSATLDLLVGNSSLTSRATGMLVRATYSRDAERAADDTAADLLAAAGMTTDGLAAIFDRFDKGLSKLPRALQYFSTHPRNEDRARQIKQRGSISGRTSMPMEDWQAIKEICGTPLKN